MLFFAHASGVRLSGDLTTYRHNLARAAKLTPSDISDFVTLGFHRPLNPPGCIPPSLPADDIDKEEKNIQDEEESAANEIISGNPENPLSPEEETTRPAEPLVPAVTPTKAEAPASKYAKQRGLPNLPSILEPVIAAIDSALEFIEALGLPVDIPSCPDDPSMMDVYACVMTDFHHFMSEVGAVWQVAVGAMKLLGGGTDSVQVLTHFHTLVANPTALAAMKVLQIPVIVSVLARRETTPDRTRNLALSLATYMSGLPSTLQIVDVATGGFGHTNLLLPSPTMRQVMESNFVNSYIYGGDPRDDLYGPYYGPDI